MKTTLAGSTSTDPAIRAAALADQFNEALFRSAAVPVGHAVVELVPASRPLTRRTAYLCGGIAGLSDADAKGWRNEAARALAARWTVLDPMARDYRGREAGNEREIVEGDLADIQASDVLLVNGCRPSWGTAMEVYAARSWGRYVVAFGVGERPSPWLVHHCHFLAPDLAGALAHLQERGG